MEISKEEEKRYAQLQMMALDFAREGNTKELELMIRHGMNVNLCTSKDDSLLMLSSYNGNIETSKMLIELGADINKINQRGQTPLEGVCFKGYLDIVKLLVQNGANFEGKAIIYASMFGNKDIVAYLKKQGIDKKSLKIFGINIEIVASITTYIKSFRKNKKDLK